MATFKNNAVKAMVVMRKAFRTVDTYTSASFKKDGLTPTQFAVLDVLYAKGSMRTGDLVDAMLATAGNITVVIRNMEKKGWITRDVDEEDRRAIRISITKQGTKKIQEALPHHISLVEEAFSCLDDEEIETLISLLKKFKNL